MRTVQIQDSIMGEWRDVPDSVRMRFNFTGRWQELGLTDTWIEVTLTRDADAIDVRSMSYITSTGTAGNSITVSPDEMQGGMSEVLRLRKRELELIDALNKAQDAYGERKRMKALREAMGREYADGDGGE